MTSPDGTPRIRPIAICVFRDGGRIFVGEHYDSVKCGTFHRPVGGGVHFGETSEQTVCREVLEELGEAVEAPRLLGVLENLFTCEGEAGHEVVFVYDGRLPAVDLYSRPFLEGQESDGVRFRAVWRDIECDQADVPPLYPDGLREMLLDREGPTP